MSHVDPHVYLQQVARRMAEPDALQTREEIETLLDELEYLYDILDPMLLDAAEQMMAQLRERLAKAG